MYVITGTFGRFGNNIYQLLNIIYEAIKNEQQIDIQKLNILNLIIDMNTLQKTFNLIYNHSEDIKKKSFFPKEPSFIKRKTN